jgi:hypothetical protein
MDILPGMRVKVIRNTASEGEIAFTRNYPQINKYGIITAKCNWDWDQTPGVNQEYVIRWEDYSSGGDLVKEWQIEPVFKLGDNFVCLRADCEFTGKIYRLVEDYRNLIVLRRVEVLSNETSRWSEGFRVSDVNNISFAEFNLIANGRNHPGSFIQYIRQRKLASVQNR